MLEHDVHVEDELWRPLCFDPNNPEERAALVRLRAELAARGRAGSICDTLAGQLQELGSLRALQARHESQKSVSRAAHRTDKVADYNGRWVYYPWSDRLVHLLAPEDFSALRLGRNLYKLTHAEQARLGQLTIGVVGLSAGHAVATTLALEGVGGHLKLADFDRLELSNLNRIRAGVHELGLPKTVITARHLMEINPYLRITLYPHGVTRDNVDEFLGGEAPVDLVIDECDTMAIKVLLRERARARRIPVVMETSDRGMLDIERFDLEPERPILHGRLGSLGTMPAAALDTLDMQTRLGIAAAIVGAESVSARLAASAMEIGETLSSWPQLGSEVVLGGATATAAVRRIALGLPVSSGRRYVDIDSLLARPPEPAQPLPGSELPPLVPLVTPPVMPPAELAAVPAHGSHGSRRGPSRELTELMRFVVSHAALAPSGGNTQPWRFYAEDTRLWLAIDRVRATSLMSVKDRPVLLGLGAALENAAIAAAQHGYAMHVQPYPRPRDRNLVAALELAPMPIHSAAPSELEALFHAMLQRATNRKPGTGELLTPFESRRLQAVAAARGAFLELVTEPRALAQIAALASDAERVRYLCEPLHREMVGELRWTADQAQARRDGIDVATLELEPGAIHGLRLAARPDVAALLRERDGGAAIMGMTRRLVSSASAVAVLSVAADGPGDWLEAGRAMQRVWHEATRMGLGFQPVGIVLYLLHMLDTPAGQVFRAHERAALQAHEQTLRRLFPLSSQRVPVMLFRLARAPMPSARSLRRSIDHILIPGAPPLVRNGDAPAAAGLDSSKGALG